MNEPKLPFLSSYNDLARYFQHLPTCERFGAYTTTYAGEPLTHPDRAVDEHGVRHPCTCGMVELLRTLWQAPQIQSILHKS